MEFALLSGSDEFGGSAIGATEGTSFVSLRSCPSEAAEANKLAYRWTCCGCCLRRIGYRRHCFRVVAREKLRTNRVHQVWDNHLQPQANFTAFWPSASATQISYKQEMNGTMTLETSTHYLRAFRRGTDKR